ncbi:MAG: hypothetical protein ABUL62_34595 [Myxococcales bacterium]
MNADKWLATNNPTPMTAGTTDNWSEVAKWHWDEGDRQGTGLGHIDLTTGRAPHCRAGSRFDREHRDCDALRVAGAKILGR